MHSQLLRWTVVATALLGAAALQSCARDEPEPSTMTTNAAGMNRVEVIGFVFEWEVVGSDLNVQISAPTTGWVAIGFNPTRAMQDADMKFGFVTDAGVEVADHIGTSPITHDFDTAQGGRRDLSNVSGVEVDGRTTLSFTMPLDSGDPTDSVLTPGAQQTIIFAWGGDGADDYTARHVERGTFIVPAL